MSKIAANIPKLFVLQGLHWFLLILPTMVLFYQANGLNYSDIFILQSLFSLAIVVLEIPTGYFADRHGRKPSLVLGFLLGAIGMLLYSLAHGFWGFLAAELSLGLGASFTSGSDQALLYDSLLEMKRKKDFGRLAGRYFSLAGISEGSASVLGGLLAALSLRLPFYVETALLVAAVFVSLSLVEPRRKVFEHPEGSLAGILGVLRFSMAGRPRLRWLILYSTAVSASTLTLFWFWQPYFAQLGLPKAWFGVVFAALHFWMSFVSHHSKALTRALGERKSLILFWLLILGGFPLVSVTHSMLGLGLALIFYGLRGLNSPYFSELTNHLVPSDRRATVLSLQALLVRLSFAIYGPLAGMISDRGGLSLAVAVSGGVFSVLAGLSLWKLLRLRRV